MRHQSGMTPAGGFIPESLSLSIDWHHGHGLAIVKIQNPTPMFLIMWFVYCVVIGFFTAYITGRSVPPSANYLIVFRVAGATSFMAYGLANLANGIWKGEPWGAWLSNMWWRTGVRSVDCRHLRLAVATLNAHTCAIPSARSRRC